MFASLCCLLSCNPCSVNYFRCLRRHHLDTLIDQCLLFIPFSLSDGQIAVYVKIGATNSDDRTSYRKCDCNQFQSARGHKIGLFQLLLDTNAYELVHRCLIAFFVGHFEATNEWINCFQKKTKNEHEKPQTNRVFCLNMISKPYLTVWMFIIRCLMVKYWFLFLEGGARDLVFIRTNCLPQLNFLCDKHGGNCMTLPLAVIQTKNRIRDVRVKKWFHKEVHQ